MKTTFRESSGTSFNGVTIETTVNKLREVLGDPQIEGNNGKDKTNFDWTCETEKEKVVTIYDWKEYRIIDEDEIISFHIGGYNSQDTQQAKNELENLLKTL